MAYGVCFEIRLYANVGIEDATSEEDAIEKANELMENDRFRGNVLLPALDDPFQWGDALGDVRIYKDLGYEDGDDSIKFSDYVKE